MMRTSTVLATLLAACLASSAAGETPALDTLSEAVTQRMDTVDRSTRRGRLQWRALSVSQQWLDRDSPTLLSDLRAARVVTRVLGRRFPADGELVPLLDDALAELAESGTSERGALAAYAGTLQHPRGERILTRALRRFDRSLLAFRTALRQTRRARLLLRGCRAVSSAAARLGLDLSLPDAAFDFSLPDVNPTSATFGVAVSPRSHLQRVSAWYFGHST